MKKLLLSLSFILALGIITACSENDTDTVPEGDPPVIENEDGEAENDTNSPDTENEAEGNEDVEDNTNADTSENNDGAFTNMDAFPYYDIEIDVSYGDHQEIEVELEESSSGALEAKYENDFEQVKIKGKEAIEKVYPLLEKANITADDNHDDIIKKLTDAFELPTDYLEFGVEIKLDDGSKIDFEIEK